MEKKNYHAPQVEITELLGTVLLWYSNSTSGDGVVDEDFFE